MKRSQNHKIYLFLFLRKKNCFAVSARLLAVFVASFGTENLRFTRDFLMALGLFITHKHASFDDETEDEEIANARESLI